MFVNLWEMVGKVRTSSTWLMSAGFLSPVNRSNLCNAISSPSRLIKTHIYKSASNYCTQKHLVLLTKFRQKRLCLQCKLFISWSVPTKQILVRVLFDTAMFIFILPFKCYKNVGIGRHDNGIQIWALFNL